MLWWKTFIFMHLHLEEKEGVIKSIDNLKSELERNMKLMGLTKISELNKNNLRF